MRKTAAWILIAVFTFHTAVMLSYLVVFYSFRSEFTEVFCENTDKPELNCRACCHLGKTLSAMENGSDDLGVPAKTTNTNEFEWNSMGVIPFIHLEFAQKIQCGINGNLHLEMVFQDKAYPPPRV